jgi:carboxymethylenebutenolidase
MQTTSIDADWVETGADNRAWLAWPAEIGHPPGVLLYIEAFGVNAHMRQVARHFAEAGYAAIVPDIYHGETFDYDDIDSALSVVRKLDDNGVMRESRQALDSLSERGIAGKPAVVGYCMGGRLAFLAGIELGKQLSATVCYYGGAIAPGKARDKLGRTPPIGRVDEMAVPVALHYGGKDRSIDAEERARVSAALDDAGKRYTLSLYPDAGHGFDCEDRKSYHAGAAAEAWALTRAFLEHHRD